MSALGGSPSAADDGVRGSSSEISSLLTFRFHDSGLSFKCRDKQTVNRSTSKQLPTAYLHAVRRRTQFQAEEIDYVRLLVRPIEANLRDSVKVVLHVLHGVLTIARCPLDRRVYCAVHPPSMTDSLPVMMEDSSEERNSTPEGHVLRRESSDRDSESYISVMAPYGEAIQIDPEYASAYRNRGISYSCLDHRDGNRGLRRGDPSCP